MSVTSLKEGTNMDRRSLERPLTVVTGIVSLSIMWQAVRFCQGLAPVPWLDAPKAMQSPLELIFLPFYYLSGIGFWMAMGVLAAMVGKVLARAVAVGVQQTSADIKAAFAEEARLAQIESNRETRRELRRKLSRERTGGSGTGAFILGTIVGAIFFR